MSSWILSEEILALYLYFSGGRKVASRDSPLTREIAKISGKSQDSIVLKTANFRSLDPKSKSRGMRNISELDRYVWERYGSNSTELSKISLDILADTSIVSDESKLGDVKRPVSHDLPDYSSETKRRVGQERVRAMALINYGEKCCLCGLDHPAVLRASHIIPWSVRSDIRGDPKNVLCLCAIHDSLFDSGFITINPDLEIIAVKPTGLHPSFEAMLEDISGRKLSLPLVRSAYPKWEYLEYHGKYVFGKFSGR